MVKKLKYLLFFIPFLFITNVNAWTLTTPYVNYEFANDTNFPQGDYATKQTHYNTSFYISPFLLGGVDYSDYVKSIYFTYYNSGFCVNQDISITGTLYGGGYGTTNGLFNDESVSPVVKNNSQALSCVFNNVNGQLMNYQCYGKGGGDFSIEFHLNSYHSPNQYLVGISENVSITCDASNLDVISNATANTNAIINNQNGNTQVIINNQNQNAQDIIDNQNQNAQDIIDNQNSNTDKEIESQKVCSDFSLNKDNIILPNSYLSTNGAILSSSTGNGITDYYEVKSNTIISVLSPIPERPQNACFYTSSKSVISCFLQSSIPEIPSNAKYIRFTLNSSNVSPRFTLSTCTNGNQALNDSITSDQPPDTTSELNNLDNSVASDTPISDLITLPITLLNVFINGIGSTCSPVNLGNLYGTDLTLPCINLEQKLGSNLWTNIDILFSIFMCYNIGMLFVNAFSGITSLRDDFDSLYQPKHADTGYQPKHGG